MSCSKPRLHQESRTHVALKDVSRTSNLYPDTYMSTDACRRIHVARSGYMLTVSQRHKYYSFMPRTSQAGNNFVADTRYMLTATSGYKWIHLASGNMCPRVNAA